LIAQFNLGILGRQMGQVIAFFLNLVFYRKGLRKSGYLEVVPAFRVDMLRRVLHFAVPAFSTTVIAASLSYLDRIFLNYYHGAAEVGIFSLGYSIAQSIGLLADAVSMALLPSLMVELAKEYQANIRKLKHFDILFCSSLALIGVLIFLSRDLIIHLLSNKNYLHSAEVLPFIVFAFVMGGFYKTVSTVLSFHSIVWFYPLLSIVAFASSAVLNYSLIPTYHEVGAAYSNFVGLFLYSLIIHVIGSRYFYRLSRILIVYAVIFLLVTYMFAVFVGII